MTAGLPRSDSSDALLYIINLSSSAAPMALIAPDAPELAGFAVFRSRRVEDGRDRYRLHLGYFDSQEQAEQCLPLVRDRYPAAWVALAPRDSMGSLDDTSVAQFKYITQKAAKLKAEPIPALTPPEAVVPVLAPSEVLSLLESSTVDVPTPVTIAPAVAPITIDVNQRFAVQLTWSTERVDTAKIARLAIFDAYTLYTVQVQRAGRRWYGLRLGFFSDPISARQVSLYARSDFSASSVVPVSERECDRASAAALASLTRAAEAANATLRSPRPAGSRADSTASGESSKTAPLKVEVKSTAAKAQAKPSKTQSTDDLLKELDSDELSFARENADPLNDTGVRHLSVSIVKRGSPFGKLRSRLSGRS